MIKGGSITKGMYLLWRGEPALVLEKELHNPGKGAAVTRLKLRGLESGNVTRETLRTDEVIEDINVENRSAQFLYKSGSEFIFMSPHTYEQYEVDEKVIGDESEFIKEGYEYQLVNYQGKTIGIILPKKMVFEIVETENAVKGDTVTGATKLAKLETGLTVKVPLFIKKGEKILVNTETREYASRKT